MDDGRDSPGTVPGGGGGGGFPSNFSDILAGHVNNSVNTTHIVSQIAQQLESHRVNTWSHGTGLITSFFTIENTDFPFPR